MNRLKAWLEMQRLRRGKKRHKTVDNLSRLGPEVVPHLLTLLRDKDLAPYVAAVVHNIGPAAIPVMMCQVSKRKDIVATIGAVERDPELIKEFDCGDFGIHISGIEQKHKGRTVAEIAAQIGPLGIPALREALADKDMVVRETAAEALGELGTDAQPSLVQSLNDVSPVVVYAAARALARMGRDAQGSVMTIVEAYKKRQLTGVDLAMFLGPIASVEQLIMLFNDQSEEVRIAAMGAMRWLREEASEAVPFLARALKSPSALISYAAAKGLYWIGPPASKAIPQLIEAIGDGDEQPDIDFDRTSITSMWVLARIGKPAEAAIPALMAHKGKWGQEVTEIIALIKQGGLAIEKNEPSGRSAAADPRYRI